MDKLSKERRSWNMSRIKSKNTAPELFVRSLLHRAGYRFRLHVKNLPGKPDIVLPKYRTVIEIYGCFWHLHSNCREGRIPDTKSDWWKEKLYKNVQRDKNHVISLNEMSWKVLIIWECLLKKRKGDEALKEYILEYLDAFLKSSELFQEIPILNNN